MSIFKKIELGSSKSQVSRWSKGFTLVELLVVIAIIGILATLVLLQLGTARAKARDAKRIADVSQIRTAAELFFDDSGGKYPGNVGPLQPCLSTATGCTGAVGTNNDLTAYISATFLPVDPLTSAVYGYAYNSLTGRTQYQVWAELERNAPAAFAADADINSEAAPAWSGTPLANVNGANEGSLRCTANIGNDCVYDVGQR